jgi:type II secretory pathway component HofQ
MRVRWSYCLGGIGLAAASLVIGLEVGKATALTGSTASTIDRSFKSDRLTPATTPGVRPSTSPSGQPKLPDGCESSASTIRIKPIIERCFAAAPAGSVLG